VQAEHKSLWYFFDGKIHIRIVILISFIYMIGGSVYFYDGMLFGMEVISQLRDSVVIKNTNNTLYISLDIGLLAGGKHEELE
jgi:hypothetical protein